MLPKMISLLLIASYILEAIPIGFVHSLHYQLNNTKLIPNKLGFSWSTCGSNKESIQVQTLSVLPDPIIIPGTIFGESRFSINTTQISPLPLSINVKKKVFFVWVTIPCEDNIGSCSYKDFCQIITKITCPQVFRKYGIPCQCPLSNGSYYLPKSAVIDIDKSILPAWLESGEYKVSASLSDRNGNQILCIDLSLAVGTQFEPIYMIDNYV